MIQSMGPAQVEVRILAKRATIPSTVRESFNFFYYNSFYHACVSCCCICKKLPVPKYISLLCMWKINHGMEIQNMFYSWALYLGCEQEGLGEKDGGTKFQGWTSLQIWNCLRKIFRVWNRGPYWVIHEKIEVEISRHCNFNPLSHYANTQYSILYTFTLHVD